MWRREERLGHWLAAVRLPPKPSWRSKLEKALLQRFRLWNHPIVVGGKPLKVESNICSVEPGFAATVCLLDDFSFLERGTGNSDIVVPERDKLRCAVRQFDPLDLADVRTLRLPEAPKTRVRQTMLAVTAQSRWLRIHFAHSPVRTRDDVQLKPPRLGSGNFVINAKAPVVTGTTRIAAIPHRRRSVDLSTLKVSEYEGYLEEARILKSIPLDRSELLGVFRHVPVEMISRLRYAAEESSIVYTVVEVSNRKRTRVHDLAAVRDEANQEIHLVSHRMRYRAVSLN